MTWQAKTIGAGVILLVIAVLAFIVKVQYDTIDRLKKIETSVVESKELSNKVLRAQSEYATNKDLKKLITDQGFDIGELKKDLRKLGGEVKGVHTVQVVTPGFVGTDLATTEEGDKNPNPPKSGEPLEDKYGYFDRTQWYQLNEPFADSTSVPIGKAGFSAWKEKPWSVEVLPRSYGSATVLGQDEDGRHYAYSKFYIEVEGKKYDVPVSDAKIVEKYPSPKLYFNPRLYLGIDGGLMVSPPIKGEVTPNVGLSFFSYGKTKATPDFSFLTLGLGYATQSRAMVLLLAPVNYNVGRPLPLIDNFHIGPSVSLDVNGNVGLYIGGRVAF